MFKLGLTGGIGSGKTFVANEFERLGARLVDADIIAREVVKPGTTGLSNITQHFGESILTPEGHLNRGALKGIIFNNEKEKHWLEALLHPLIRQQIVHQLNTPGATYNILVSPLLFETQQHNLVDATLMVDCPPNIQIERTMARDGIDQSLAKKIMESQMPREEKIKRSGFIIDNSGSTEDTLKQVLQLHNQFLEAQ